MPSVINSLIPIFTLIFSGVLMKRSNFLPEDFWPAAEKLTYYLLTPALLIYSLANKKVDDLPWREMLLTVQGTVLISALLLSLWWLFNRQTEGALFTSVFQGGVRFNCFVALAIAEALFGTKGVLLAAMGAGFMIPLINLLCVSAFSLTVASAKVSLTGFVYNLATNPLILGCVIGGSLNLSGIGLHPALGGTLALAGKAAFPLGLMAVGAAYRMGNLSRQWRPLLISSLVQLGCKPLTAWGLASYFSLTGNAATVAILLFAVPTAPSAFILSRQLGGDHVTMASIITVQTGLSFLSLPLTLMLLG
jgi:predicted permease